MHMLVLFTAKYLVALPVIALPYVLISLKTRQQRLRFIVHALIAVVITLLLVKLATTAHSDPRPFVRDGVTPYFMSSTDNGFPSDHTAFSALIGWVILFWRRRLGIVLIVLSLLIGSARVIAGVHHGQDIVGGFTIGVISATTGYLIYRLLPVHKK